MSVTSLQEDTERKDDTVGGSKRDIIVQILQRNQGEGAQS